MDGQRLFPFLVLTLAACSAPGTSLSATTAAPTPSATRSATPAPATASPTASATPTAGPSASPSSAAAVRYVAIGASDTVGVGASDPVNGSWPARVARLLPAGSSYINLGVSGSLAAEARVQQLPVALAQKPTLVTVWLAVNDLNAPIDRAAYADALGATVGALATGTDAKIFVGNVPDLRPVPAYASADKNALFARITEYNGVIADLAARYPSRVFVVDLFTGSADLVSTITVSTDGFHPSDSGYQLIADRFAAAIRASGVPLRA